METVGDFFLVAILKLFIAGNFVAIRTQSMRCGRVTCQIFLGPLRNFGELYPRFSFGISIVLDKVVFLHSHQPYKNTAVLGAFFLVLT